MASRPSPNSRHLSWESGTEERTSSSNDRPPAHASEASSRRALSAGWSGGPRSAKVQNCWEVLFFLAPNLTRTHDDDAGRWWMMMMAVEMPPPGVGTNNGDQEEWEGRRKGEGVRGE